MKFLHTKKLPGVTPNGEQLEIITPTLQSERIVTIDVVRGIAVLGILLLNIIGFGLAYAYDDPTAAGGSSGLNYYAWAIVELLFEGTMRGLFTMLFGAGFLLFVSHGLAKGAGIRVADLYYRRISWLILFGVIHGYVLLWHGDILFTYGVCGLTLFAFRTISPKYLVIFGVFLLCIGTGRYYMDYRSALQQKNEAMALDNLLKNNVDLSAEQLAIHNDWYSPEKQNDRIVNENQMMLQKDYFSVFKHRFWRTRNNQTLNLYDYNIWDSLSFMLIGMALYTWGILQGRRSYRFYLAMIIVGYVVGLLINYYEISMVANSHFDAVAISKSKITYHAGRLFTALGHIGLIMVFIKSGILRFFQNTLAAVGRMAFTNYIMQTILCKAFFLGLGFGMFGKLQRYELYYVVFVVWVIQMIYSPIWLKYFRYGPLEWLWRSLTYKKIQPFRI